MTSLSLCAQCGAPIDTGSLGGLCSACVGRGVLLEEPPDRPQPLLDPTPDSAPGQVEPRQIGPYRLLRPIGEGGFGVVHLAEQLTPVKRQVALKVVKLGMNTRQVVARFEAERQALALMDHPGIAKVFDAGATETGRPYFVMEFVEGIPITDYANRHRLTTSQRLELFIKVCEAVQHAHQKGVIHRDLKPSNILVAVQDGQPLPKVIDFGLAKATQLDLTDRTLITHFQQLVGTPAYMSPEQAQAGAVDVDTRSDLYSLGVLLYELLTGRTPFESHELLQGGMHEVCRRIREQDPPSLPTKLGALPADELELVARDRRATPEQIRRAVRGDLDWIVMRALEKNRTRRYETASALALDVRRHLSHEPVSARPPTALYQFQKLVRRNKLAVGSAAAVTLALMIGLSASTFAFVKERQARRYAGAKAEESRQRLVRLNVSSGNRLVEQGEWHAALIWFVAALALDEGDPIQQRVHRQRIGAVLRQAPQLTQLWIHDAFIYAAAFSPDGLRLASGSLDRTARVWDTVTGEPVTPPLLHPREVLEVRFTLDGGRLITLAEDQKLRIWDAKSGQAIAELPTQTRSQCYDISQDGDRLVAPVPGGAQIFNLETGEAIGLPLAHERKVSVACFLQDGRRVLTASREGGLMEWVLGPTNTAAQWISPSHAVSRMALSPDGGVLATVAQPHVQLWDTRSRKMLSELPPQKGNLYQPAFSPDGRWLATVGFEVPTRVWNVTNGQAVSPPLLHEGGVQRAVFSPDNRHLATASWDRTARVWDANTGERVVPILRHAGFVLVAAFSPDGQQLLTAGQDETARLWLLRTNAGARLTFVHNGPVWLAAYDQQGKRILTGSTDGLARVWEAQSGRLLASFPHREPVFDGGFCADDRRVVISCRTTAHVWDLASGSEMGPPARHGGHINFIEVSSDGKTFVTASQDGTARVWSVEDLSPITPPLTNGPVVHYARFSPDGQRVVTAGASGHALMWDARTGLRLGPDLPVVGRVTRARFSPDGQRIITAGTDDTMLPLYAQVWDVQTGHPVGPKLEHGDGVRDAAFSPNGRLLASGGEDFAALVWDAATGERLTPALRHRGFVVYTVFSPDSRLLLTVSWDGTARVWDAATGDPVSPPLQHGGPVRIGRWSPSGHEVLTGSEDGTARLWDFSPEPGGLEELRHHAEVLSAHRIAPNLGPVALTAKEQQASWETLRRR